MAAIQYPLAALVGQDDLKLALLLAAVNPALGGVLICGERGTAKSTAARALAELLPPLLVRSGCPCNTSPDDPQLGWHDSSTAPVVNHPVPFVELPLGATEDRIVGTLDFERAIRDGRRAFQPGILAQANRGILYVDEVNLLADHLVDLLLDAAASGQNVVQREGIEVLHPARFLLIGTMNPEEGTLRPQLLDRFALMVEVRGPADPRVRAEVIRRRMAFDATPQEFAAEWAEKQLALREQIIAARERLSGVQVPESIVDQITITCARAGVDGLRADIALYKAVQALAALEGRLEATGNDVARGAHLVLPHRAKRQALDNTKASSQTNGAGQGTTFGSPSAKNPANEPQPSNGCEADCGCGEEASEGAIDSPEELFAAQTLNSIPSIDLKSLAASARSRPGRRESSGLSREGQFLRAIPDPHATDIALGATIRSAALNGPDGEGRLQVLPENRHRQERRATSGALVLFVVDSSGSMAARRRMEVVKGAVLGLLDEAREERDRVAVITFRGPEARLPLPPGRSIDLARDALQTLPTGGRTPLAHALRLAGEVIGRERTNDADRPIQLVLITDGKSNVALPGTSADPWEQTRVAAEELASTGIRTLVLDTEQGFIRHGRAQKLAGLLRGDYQPLEELSADSLLQEIGQRSDIDSRGAEQEVRGR